uniref:Uncharacterized protein n=1 Tax=Leersia perrieri TaxID=77586 RepID=A0A0D9XD85_9ORYZ
MASAAAKPTAASPCSRAAHDDVRLPHVAIFPFMSRGHTISLIHLACLLRRLRLAAVTLFTTPNNAPFVRRELEDDDDVAVLELPFPVNHHGMECVEALDSVSSLPAFVEATSLLRPRLEAEEEKGVGGEAARNMAALAVKAREAVGEGGSSWKMLEEMISALCLPADQCLD